MLAKNIQLNVEYNYDGVFYHSDTIFIFTRVENMPQDTNYGEGTVRRYFYNSIKSDGTVTEDLVTELGDEESLSIILVKKKIKPTIFNGQEFI